MKPTVKTTLQEYKEYFPEIYNCAYEIFKYKKEHCEIVILDAPVKSGKRYIELCFHEMIDHDRDENQYVGLPEFWHLTALNRKDSKNQLDDFTQKGFDVVKTDV